jgi:hypothetical protein
MQPRARMRREARDEAVGVSLASRMSLGQGAAGDAEGERDSRRSDEKMPLQDNLPTDFAG